MIGPRTLDERNGSRENGPVAAGGERGDADDVHVVLDRLARGFFGRREQRPDIDVEAEIGERRGDDLLAAVVAVLADLGDQDARAAALVLLEGAGHRARSPVRRRPHAASRL
jgi:hypothetical protein